MRILVLSENEKKSKVFVKAFKQKKINVQFISISQISLVSKHKNTLIKAVDENIPKYDAVFLDSRISLAPFIEPLLEEFENKNIFCNSSRGSYFLGMNVPYMFVNLSSNNIKIPRTIASGSGENIQRISKKISYPLIANSFNGADIQQEIVIHDKAQLTSFIKSIKSNIDGFMLREFINANVKSCLVIGEKVFAVERKVSDYEVQNLEKGNMIKLTDIEKENVINASKSCGFGIAQIDISNGYVLSVNPVFSLKKFNKLCSDNIENYIVNYFIDNVKERGEKKNVADDVKDLADKISKTIFSRFIK